MKPNAGLPKQRDGQTYYDVSPEEFAEDLEKIVEMGGRCCGRMLRDHTGPYPGDDREVPGVFADPGGQRRSINGCIFLRPERLFSGEGSKIIGERINPYREETGSSRR